MKSQILCDFTAELDMACKSCLNVETLVYSELQQNISYHISGHLSDRITMNAQSNLSIHCKHEVWVSEGLFIGGTFHTTYLHV